MIKKNKMHEYTIHNGKFIGKFEELYKDFKDPFAQTKIEKFETTKKIILNYCQMIKDKKKNKIKTFEIGCGFGKLTKDLNKLGFNSSGMDISKTAIKKARTNSKCKFYVSDLLNYDLYLQVTPDIIIMPEVTWYLLPQLKPFLNFLRKNFKNKYLIHTLATYEGRSQKYGRDYFKNLEGILKYFNLNYIEYGQKYDTKINESRTFFLAKI